MVGERILNRFVLQERLGSGGFGTVYRAWDERLERDVAVKAFEAQGAGDPRVLREAQAAARLNHSGIVTLYELGGDGSRTYLVSELVEGETLSARNRVGTLADRDIAELGLDTCEALAHAHERGVVHRDIKPQNILVADGSGRAKLMDFGIARVLGSSPLTAAGDIIGTISYMAPEQAEGDIAGPASDVYSLALTLYECWAGEQPFARGSPAATTRAIGKGAPLLAELRSDLPEELTTVIDECLLAEPALRPRLDELADGLDAVLPLLDREPLGPLEERTRPTGPMRVLHHPAVAPALSFLAVGSLSMAALTTGGAPGWAVLLSFPAGALATIAPRLAYLAVAAGLVGWLATAGQPGGALVLAVLTMPQVILLPNAGRLWPLPAAAPLLGAIGLAPVYAALAGVCGTLPRRLLLGALGYFWLVVAEAAWGTTLLFGVAEPAEGNWAEQASTAASDLLAPVVTRPALLGALVWALAAACLAPLLRGRVLTLELLGVLVWAAGLLSAQRLLSQWEDAAAPAAAGLVVGVSLLVIATLLYRSGAPRHEGLADSGGSTTALRGGGGAVRLP